MDIPVEPQVATRIRGLSTAPRPSDSQSSGASIPSMGAGIEPLTTASISSISTPESARQAVTASRTSST